ncbi:MAG: IS30 family transposase [Nanoarchaeota archaeon]
MIGMKKHKQIQASERDQIAILLASGTSLRQIAKKLGRAFSSVRDEVVRNSKDGAYQAIRAEVLSRGRNLSCRKINPLKDPKIYSYVFDKLRCGWSPEQIAGRLMKENRGRKIICHETIYRYVYSKEGRKKNLFEYLVRKHRKRRTWYGRATYRRGIPDRVSIHQRSLKIKQKKQFGHWEVDTVEGKGHTGVHTFLERNTRFYQARLMDNVDSESGVRVQLQVFGKLPRQARRSSTFDNGKENYNHTKLKIHLGMKTYFCDPNCAWQKGANEHHNGVLRRYIPKKTDLSTVSQIELDSIVDEINDRPRKCLKWSTPKEKFLTRLSYYQLQSRKEK